MALGEGARRAGEAGGERRGERRSRSGSRSPRRRSGHTARASGSLPRRHLLQSEPRPRTRGAEPPPPPPRSLSCSAPPGVGYLGAGAAGARGDATWRAGRGAQLHHVGRAPQEPPAVAPPADSRAGLRPGNLRAPARQGPAVPFPLREVSDSSPSARGRCPRRGFESSDYLIAADTKPIFLPL